MFYYRRGGTPGVAEWLCHNNNNKHSNTNGNTNCSCWQVIAYTVIQYDYDSSDFGIRAPHFEAVCVSSLRRAHDNNVCIVPSVMHDPRRESFEVVYFELARADRRYRGGHGLASLSLSLSLYIYIYIYICIYIYIYIYICMCVCIYIYTRESHVVYVNVCVYIYIYKYTHMCYIYIYIHTYHSMPPAAAQPRTRRRGLTIRVATRNTYNNSRIPIRPESSKKDREERERERELGGRGREGCRCRFLVPSRNAQTNTGSKSLHKTWSMLCHSFTLRLISVWWGSFRSLPTFAHCPWRNCQPAGQVTTSPACPPLRCTRHRRQSMLPLACSCA